MDLTHGTYVHAGSIGQAEILESRFETVVEGQKDLVRRWMPGIDAPPFWRGALGQEGPVDRWQVCEFQLPSVVIIDAGVAAVSAGSTLASHDQGVRGFVMDFMTPQSATRHHSFGGMVRNLDIDDAGFTARFTRQQGGVCFEDKAIPEERQPSLAGNPDLSPVPYRIDEGRVRARQLIARAIEAEATAMGEAA